MPQMRPFVVLCGFAAALAAFWFAGQWLDADGLFARNIVAQLGGPLAAAVVCLIAAVRGSRTDRMAWFLFGSGATLYFAGNLCYLFFALAEFNPSFPALPEVAYFAMALLFAAGMFEYGKVRERVSRIQVYNFILIYCAVALGSLFILHRSVSASVMGPFATIVAFLYPAIWLSVAASGLLSLLLYRPRGKTLPFALLLAAVLAEAVADCLYALALLDGTYQSGGIVQLLWVASIGLIGWAGIEHIVQSRRAEREPEVKVPHVEGGMVQAVMPAVAIVIILLSGSLSGALEGGHLYGLATALALAFAVAAGLREYWILRMHRQLRGAIELSRGDLAMSEQRLLAVLESTSDSVISVDRDWRVEYFNQRAARSVQGSTTLVLGASLWDLFPTEVNTVTSGRYREAMATRASAGRDRRIVRRLLVRDQRLSDGRRAFDLLPRHFRAPEDS